MQRNLNERRCGLDNNLIQSHTTSNLDAATVDEIQTWADVFRKLDQWDTVETFADHNALALDTRAGFRRFCSPKIGYILAHDCGRFQIIHHVHQDGVDDVDDDDKGDIWAINGAGGTAAAVVLSSTETYDKQTGASCESFKMAHWTEIKNVAILHQCILQMKPFSNGLTCH